MPDDDPVPVIRPATHADVPAITNCYLRSWRAAYRDHLDSEILEIEAEKRRPFDWHHGIDDDTASVLIATIDGAVVGVVQAELSPASPRDLPEITMLYVDTKAWGTGAASRLLEVATSWMRARGTTAARLRVVEVHGRARRFYEREGWVVDQQMQPARNDFARLIYYRRTI